MARAEQWAIRCTHEASMWEENSFITLTYDQKHMPWTGSLVKPHLQKFFKRLRAKHPQRTIRYFACGEYGEQLSRPHYHACIFNYAFTDDRYLWADTDGHHTFRSEELEKIWPFGFSTISDFDFKAAAYTARYVMKKITGPPAKDHYLRRVTESLSFELEPEYVTMSLKPGIGKTWYDKFKADCYPKDFVTHHGKRFRNPRYYDKLYEQEHPDELLAIKTARQEKANQHWDDNSPNRLRQKEECAYARLENLPRPYEN